MEQDVSRVLRKEKQRRRLMFGTLALGVALVVISTRSERAMFGVGTPMPGVFATLRGPGRQHAPRVAARSRSFGLLRAAGPLRDRPGSARGGRARPGRAGRAVRRPRRGYPASRPARSSGCHRRPPVRWRARRVSRSRAQRPALFPRAQDRDGVHWWRQLQRRWRLQLWRWWRLQLRRWFQLWRNYQQLGRRHNQLQRRHRQLRRHDKQLGWRRSADRSASASSPPRRLRARSPSRAHGR